MYFVFDCDRYHRGRLVYRVLSMAADKQKVSPRKVGSVKAWVYTLLAAGLIFFVFLEVFILIMVGMVPTISAFLIDRSPRRYFTMTVAFANVVGVVPSAFRLFSGGSGGIDGALELITDPLVLLSMYGAGAIGWFILYIVPPFVSVGLSMSNQMKTKALKKRQKELVDNWGEEIRSDAQKLLPDNVKLPVGEGESVESNANNDENTPENNAMPS